MTLLTASDLAKSYGPQDVLQGVRLAIHDRDRIALVGPNGVGKTTLLRLIVGLEFPDEGRIHRSKNLHIGYLPQEVIFADSERVDLSQSVWAYCEQAFADLLELEDRLREFERRMGEGEASERLIDQYGTLQEAFEQGGGYTYSVKIQRVLLGLGFDETEFHRALQDLSGGERTRVMLGRLLLESPGLLLLDEPTNHLDIQAIEWLEGWLRDYPGAAVLVSHDRYFLDECAQAVWELTPMGIEEYKGNYSAYVQQREARFERRWKEYRSQQEHIEREREYIRRNIAGQNTRQAQGRRKRLERFLRDEAIRAPQAGRDVHIDFGAVNRSGDRVLETKDLAVGYPEPPGFLFDVPDLLLSRGECAAIIGPNGVGKSTFLKTLLGDTAPLAGEARLGASVEVGYFAQAHKDLNPGHTVLEEFLSISPGMPISQARDLLAKFLFTGDDVFKSVDVLSGGERGRLALAKLAQEGANLLLLDEPTNHLDLPSQEILQAALMDFPGTILLVSHDRYLIEALATQIWAVSSTERELRVYLGSYKEYTVARARELEAQKSHARRASEVKSRRSNSEPGGRSKRPTRQGLSQLEAQIAQLEAALRTLEGELSAAGSDFNEVRRLGKEYALHERALAAAMSEWEDLARELAEEA
jgi:ATP-binding cassette subfamily F protein 3